MQAKFLPDCVRINPIAPSSILKTMPLGNSRAMRHQCRNLTSPSEGADDERRGLRAGVSTLAKLPARCIPFLDEGLDDGGGRADNRSAA
jgi:hypothetical protein